MRLTPTALQIRRCLPSRIPAALLDNGNGFVRLGYAQRSVPGSGVAIHAYVFGSRPVSPLQPHYFVLVFGPSESRL